MAFYQVTLTAVVESNGMGTISSLSHLRWPKPIITELLTTDEVDQVAHLEDNYVGEVTGIPAVDKLWELRPELTLEQIYELAELIFPV